MTEPIENLPTLTLETLMSVLVAVLPYVVGLLVVSVISFWLVRVFSSGRA
jgi:hypothetical protein